MYRGTTLGEASNPGPQFIARSANVTSLPPHLQYVVDFECDVAALQEVRLTIDSRKNCGRGAEELGQKRSDVER